MDTNDFVFGQHGNLVLEEEETVYEGGLYGIELVTETAATQDTILKAEKETTS
jgi:hypothetical protein